MAEMPRDDPEASQLLTAMGHETALRFMTGPSPAQAPVVLALTPLYRDAEQHDALRVDISLDDAAWWARTVCTPLIARVDLSDVELRALIRKFAVPALFR